MSTRTFTIAQDTGLLSPSYGNGAGTTMWAAWSPTYSNQSRMVLKFTPDWKDISSITSAVLHIKSGNVMSYSTPRVLIKRITTPWNEGSWAGGDNGAGGQPGAVVYPGPTTTDTNMVDWSPGTSRNTWVTVDITNIVKDWAPIVGVSDGKGLDNNGIMIREYTEGSNTNNWDAKTRESGDGAYIVVTYETGFVPTPSGIEILPRSLDTQYLLMRGASEAYVTESDTWRSTIDPLSWGSSYSWTETPGSTASIEVRGQSFKWYATVPTGKGGGTARVDITNTTNNQHISKVVTLPEGLSADSAFEVSYESGIMLPDITYTVTITALSGFVSIDSFEGYWEGSLVNYNEDSRRLVFQTSDSLMQLYDGRYTAGSIYKWNDPSNYATFDFIGDRVVVLSALGPSFGKMRIQLLRSNGQYNSNPDPVLLDGTQPYTIVDLDNGKRGGEVSRYIAFDSKDHTTLEWGEYRLLISIDPSNGVFDSTYDALYATTFPDRCHNCVSDTSETFSTARYVYLDGIMCHEEIALSANFQNQNHFDILTSMAEAVQVEASVSEDGINFIPRVGQDTDIILREGQNTVVSWGIVNDLSSMASVLYSNGGTIDGMPLFTITQDSKNKKLLGRNIVRQQDFRDMTNYLQLIGMSRTELKKRRLPDKRVSISHVAKNLDLDLGDSFILYSKKMGKVRLKIVSLTEKESASSGKTYDLTCERYEEKPRLTLTVGDSWVDPTSWSGSSAYLSSVTATTIVSHIVGTGDTLTSGSSGSTCGIAAAYTDAGDYQSSFEFSLGASTDIGSITLCFNSGLSDFGVGEGRYWDVVVDDTIVSGNWTYGSTGGWDLNGVGGASYFSTWTPISGRISGTTVKLVNHVLLTEAGYVSVLELQQMLVRPLPTDYIITGV